MDKAYWDLKVKAEKIRRILFPKKDMTSPILNWIGWIWCLRYFKFRCAYCGRKMRLYAEHFKPRWAGGELTKNNIIPTCKRCNRIKGNYEAMEWYVNQPFFDKRRLENILSYLERGETIKGREEREKKNKIRIKEDNIRIKENLRLL